MPTILEYAKLSGYVYAIKRNPFLGMKINSVNDIFTTIPNGWAIVTDLDTQYTKPSNPFYAQLFIKFRNHRAVTAVIAIRGTVTSQSENVIEDIRSWNSDVMGNGNNDVLPKDFTKALRFTKLALLYLQHYYRDLYNAKAINFTGHSLGGAIAQLLVLKKYPYYAVVFNAPGCGNIPGIDLSRKNQIINVNSLYGLINKAGQIVGKVIWVGVPNDEKYARKMYAKFDRGEYKTSMTDYKLSDSGSWATEFTAKLSENLSGFAERIAAYTPATGTVSTMPSVKKEIDLCEANIKWYTFAPMAKKAHCITSAYIDGFVNVVTAQHSIMNMIKTLETPQYAKIAAQRIGKGIH
ncbi:unnamed protein product [marine sediment metagenome]|uniref:Fungal lipase-type domain-containing protein n=1 Tax=marine sediment metagenome TaxID=412755 RepID=X0YT51_9ZZZZ